jgi:predicted enzyme related to lactoylglutathione lyase
MMPAIDKYAPGTFCWLDYITTEQPKAKEFYSGLFGWETEDMPVGEHSIYTMARVQGKDVAAISPMMDAAVEAGVPPHWNLYINVEDINAATEKAKELGAKVMAGPMDVMDAGKMTMIIDPSGAAINLWQAGTHPGAALVNEPGGFTWSELLTKDAQAAKTFYSGLFGWTVESSPMPNGVEYHQFKSGERMIGGMMEIQAAWGDMPPAWFAYFSVADLDASLKKVVELGGKVMSEPVEIPGTGTFAMINDSQGGFVYLMQLASESTKVDAAV